MPWTCTLSFDWSASPCECQHHDIHFLTYKRGSRATWKVPQTFMLETARLRLVFHNRPCCFILPLPLAIPCFSAVHSNCKWFGWGVQIHNQVCMLQNSSENYKNWNDFLLFYHSWVEISFVTWKLPASNVI